MKTTRTSGTPPPNPAHPAPDDDDWSTLPHPASGSPVFRVKDQKDVLRIEHNVIDLKGAMPLYSDRSNRFVHCVNNTNSAGVPIHGEDRTTGKSLDRFFPELEDAFVLAL